MFFFAGEAGKSLTYAPRTERLSKQFSSDSGGEGDVENSHISMHLLLQLKPRNKLSGERRLPGTSLSYSCFIQVPDSLIYQTKVWTLDEGITLSFRAIGAIKQRSSSKQTRIRNDSTK
ncbi:MAG: hypothetical protein CL912_23020 [Deltaproteobacteria bacterium]|nr:hypothetical protein [Deltaproteobacteria bacterium]